MLQQSVTKTKYLLRKITNSIYFNCVYKCYSIFIEYFKVFKLNEVPYKTNVNLAANYFKTG